MGIDEQEREQRKKQQLEREQFRIQQQEMQRKLEDEKRAQLEEKFKLRETYKEKMKTATKIDVIDDSGTKKVKEVVAAGERGMMVRSILVMKMIPRLDMVKKVKEEAERGIDKAGRKKARRRERLERRKPRLKNRNRQRDCLSNREVKSSLKHSSIVIVVKVMMVEAR